MPCCNKDLDDVFAYKTPMIARIRDRKLGLCRLLFSFLIVCYIGIYNIIVLQGFAKQGILTGRSRLSLQAPTIDSTNGNTAGCNLNDPSCLYNFQRPETLSYCSQSNLPYTGIKFPCSALKASQLATGLGSGNEYFLATKQQVHITSQHSLYKDRIGGVDYKAHLHPAFCIQSQTNCSKYAYATDPLQFTALFDHGFVSKGINITGESRRMKGVLISNNKELCTERSLAIADKTKQANGNIVRVPNEIWKEWDGYECSINPNKTSDCVKNGKSCGYDIFSLSILFDLLKQDGSEPNSLDIDADTEDPSTVQNKTYRDQGINMNIKVTYSNSPNKPWIDDEISYRIEIDTVPQQTAKWEESITTFLTSNNSIESIADSTPIEITTASAGIKINVEFQDGKVLKWDPSTLLTNLTSALTLMAIVR